MRAGSARLETQPGVRVRSGLHLSGIPTEGHEKASSRYFTIETLPGWVRAKVDSGSPGAGQGTHPQPRGGEVKGAHRAVPPLTGLARTLSTLLLAGYPIL